MSGGERFNRIVSLVADLTRRDREGHEAPTIRELAGQLGISEREVSADIRTLTVLGDRVNADWLLSLRIFQQGDHVSLSSGGPFRRPIRLSPEEQLAIQVALAMDPAGAELGKRFAALGSGDTASPRAASPVTHADLLREAVRERRVLSIEYAGEGQHETRRRLIHPYQVLASGVRTYVIAWSTEVNQWRHFRLDRIASVRREDAHFDPRPDFRPLSHPREVFSGRERSDRVTVRFRAEVAPWVQEFYADHEAQADGSVIVHLQASSPHWLVRRVLEHGPDVEVMEPAEYREAVRRAVA